MTLSRLVFQRVFSTYRYFGPVSCRYIYTGNSIPTRAATGMLSTGFSSTPKPPNVLVYSPQKDSTSNGFSRVIESLETCLSPERYVIYPIGLEDMVQYSPWKSNCKLLMVPPMADDGLQESQDTNLELPPKVIAEMATFVQAGGSILSLHSQLNRFFEFSFSKAESLQEKVQKFNIRNHESSIVEFKDDNDSNQFPCLTLNQNSQYDFSGVFLDTPLANTLESKTSVGFYVCRKALNKSNTNQSNNSEEGDAVMPHDSAGQASRVAVVQKMTLKGGGKVVVAGVDLLPVLPAAMKLEMLMELSRGVSQRRKVLSDLLTWFDLACSKETLPELSHTYLLCSDEVRMARGKD